MVSIYYLTFFYNLGSNHLQLVLKMFKKMFF